MRSLVGLPQDLSLEDPTRLFKRTYVKASQVAHGLSRRSLYAVLRKVSLSRRLIAGSVQKNKNQNNSLIVMPKVS